MANRTVMVGCGKKVMVGAGCLLAIIGLGTILIVGVPILAASSRQAGEETANGVPSRPLTEDEREALAEAGTKQALECGRLSNIIESDLIRMGKSNEFIDEAIAEEQRLVEQGEDAAEFAHDLTSRAIDGQVARKVKQLTAQARECQGIAAELPDVIRQERGFNP